MSLDVKVPAAGESITSANVARWHKQNGDAVAKGEILVTLETDKVSNELEAAEAGTLEILVGEGEEVSIGTVIARKALEITGSATVIGDASYDELIDMFCQESSIKRPNKVEEVAAVAVMLASDAARNITGNMFPVDGGTMPY